MSKSKQDSILIGIDLGGTKTEVIALSDSGETLLRERVDTVRDDYSKTLSTIKKLVDHVEKTLSATGSIGVGMPGAISPATGLIKNANSTWLNGKSFHKDLESTLGRPVKLANDANCFVLSEAIDGAAKDFNNVFGVIIGTGTGGGVVISRQLVIGVNAIAGEWGHNPLPWPGVEEFPGPQCYCGKTGCIETFLSGPGLEHDYLKMTGFSLTAEAIVEKAQQGVIDPRFALNRYERRLAKSLASVINILDPDAIVLGGGLSNIEQLYTQVPKLWGEYVFSDKVATKLLPAMHGDSSGVRGAAWLWLKI